MSKRSSLRRRLRPVSSEHFCLRWKGRAWAITEVTPLDPVDAPFRVFYLRKDGQHLFPEELPPDTGMAMYRCGCLQCQAYVLPTHRLRETTVTRDFVPWEMPLEKK